MVFCDWLYKKWVMPAEQKCNLTLAMSPTVNPNTLWGYFRADIYVCNCLSYLLIYELLSSVTDRQKKVKHMSPPCNMHRWTEKVACLGPEAFHRPRIPFILPELGKTRWLPPLWGKTILYITKLDKCSWNVVECQFDSLHTTTYKIVIKKSSNIIKILIRFMSSNVMKCLSI